MKKSMVLRFIILICCINLYLVASYAQTLSDELVFEVVLSNNNANYNRIWVKGTVIPCTHPVSENYPYEYGSGLWMNFEVMAFGTIGKGGTKTMKLKYVNDTDNDIQLMFVVIGGNTDLKFTSPRQVKAREEGVMPVEYQYSGSFPTETRVYPVINGRALMKPLKITCTNPVD